MTEPSSSRPARRLLPSVAIGAPLESLAHLRRTLTHQLESRQNGGRYLKVPLMRLLEVA
jgi:hypothetical protein